jgi:hypothetical protein
MFNIRAEGEVIKQGINFYPKKSNHIGFVLRIKDKLIFVRYSRIIKRFIFSRVQLH